MNDKTHKPRPAYLNERSMSALRRGDTVSGRTNQMIERYLSMVEEDGADVRATFNGAEWDALLSARPVVVRDRTMAEMRDGFVCMLLDHPVLQSIVQHLDGASFAVLLELLEREPMQATRRMESSPGIDGDSGKDRPDATAPSWGVSGCEGTN